MRQKREPKILRGKKLGDRSFVLQGKNFRWRHKRGLKLASRGIECGHRRNNGFSGSHIALEEAVHWPVLFAIFENFPGRTFLSWGEGERQGLNKCADVRFVKGDWCRVLLLEIPLGAKGMKMNEKQFVKLKSASRGNGFVHRFWKMNVVERSRHIEESDILQDVVWHPFVDARDHREDG